MNTTYTVKHIQKGLTLFVNIFAIGFPSSFAFAELSAARQQSIGVFAFVACCFADFVKHFNPLFSVSCSI